jgi:hypothetical protein
VFAGPDQPVFYISLLASLLLLWVLRAWSGFFMCPWRSADHRHCCRGGGPLAPRTSGRRRHTASLTLMVAFTAVVGSGTALFLAPRCRPLRQRRGFSLAQRYLAVTVHSPRCWAWACQRGAAARAGDARHGGHAVAALVTLLTRS